jgi:predicted RNA binding protein YcfA (HicA-like mRNA interferase family)
MTRLTPLPYRRVERALKKLGFQPVRQSGSHVIFAHADGRTTVVPKHTREPIGPGLLRQIIRDVRDTPSRFLALT